ncbi:MAG: hypothetical protein J6E31_02585, partial [Pyramidobacter sp.]|nr:hypothetical protein [Pyramidobacter sp.]
IAFVVMAAGCPFFRKVSRWLGGLFLLALFVGCVEYYVLLFRGVPFMMVDLLAWRAAAAVAGHYRFAVSAQLAAAILLTAFLTVLAAVRCYAGLKLSAVERFLLKMRRTIPAINVNGYFAGGSWHGKDERTEYSSLLRDYSYVQSTTSCLTRTKRRR